MIANSRNGNWARIRKFDRALSQRMVWVGAGCRRDSGGQDGREVEFLQKYNL